VSERPLIAVLDYGIGNLASAQKALVHEGADARLTADHGLIRDAAAVVLPGVGAFGACMGALRRADLEDVAIEAASSGRPFFGICVGMQMLFDRSEETPGVAGLGVVPGIVAWIPPGVKRPQMQWNTLDIHRADDPMFAGLTGDTWVYFVHSLHGIPSDTDAVVATCDYGAALTAAVRVGNVFATQFHPEKSSRSGLRVLRNFVAVAAGLVAA
jgi:glutamine amidotransferase